jgi:RNA polymerase sigma-70 factor (ECF subfamily)
VGAQPSFPILREREAIMPNIGRHESVTAVKRGDAVVAQLPDQVLIDSIIDGDKDALRQFYLRHYDYVLRIVTRHTRNAAVAEEVANEVFLEVWRTAKSFEAKSQVTTWLMAVARNKALSAMRRRTEAPLDEGYAATIEDPADDAAVSFEKRKRSEILRKCLMQLPRSQREVIDLVYYQEKSVGEAARSIGIPAATVRTRMFYARSRIAEMLSNIGVDRAWAAI